MGMFEVGVAKRSGAHIDPPLHLLVSNREGYATWCGGGPAFVANTVTQRRCVKCLALAREDLVDNPVEPHEPSDLDWFVQRTPVKPPPEGN